jgi:hypothetical protein
VADDPSNLIRRKESNQTGGPEYRPDNTAGRQYLEVENERSARRDKRLALLFIEDADPDGINNNTCCQMLRRYA